MGNRKYYVITILIISIVLWVYWLLSSYTNNKGEQQKRNYYGKINAIKVNNVFSAEYFQNHVCILKVNNISSINFSKGNYKPLNNSNKLKINLYNPHNDNLSDSIHQLHNFSGHSILKQFLGFIQLNYPKIQFVDIGCHLGIYSLVLVQRKHLALCVDPVLENLMRVARSIYDNTLDPNFIKLVWNALTNKRQLISIKDDFRKSHREFIADSTSKLWSIFLNDLTILLNKTMPVIIKIDMEPLDMNILSKSSRLLKDYNVQIIIMRWKNFCQKPHCYHVQGIFVPLLNYGYIPYSGFLHNSYPLFKIEYTYWPDEIIWHKSVNLKFLHEEPH